jgi:uncharacterized protein (DUF3084 family)
MTKLKSCSLKRLTLAEQQLADTRRLIKDIEVKLGESNEESAKAMEQKEESLCRQKELENLLNGLELESQLSVLHLEIDNLLAEKDILIEEKESLRAKRTEALQSVRERISHADTELEDARKEKTAMDEKIKALKSERSANTKSNDCQYSFGSKRRLFIASPNHHSSLTSPTSTRKNSISWES